MWKIVRKIFKPVRFALIATVFAMLFEALDGVVTPYFLGVLTNSLAGSHWRAAVEQLMLWGAGLLIIHVGMTLSAILSNAVVKKINISLRTTIVRNAYQEGQLDTKAGDFVAESLNDVKQIDSEFVQSTISFIYCLLQAGLTLILLLKTSWQVGLVFVGLGFIPALVPRLTSRWLKAGTRTWSQNNAVYTTTLEDTIRGRRLVTRYGAFKAVLSRQHHALTAAEDAYVQMQNRQSLSELVVGVLYVLTTISSLALGVSFVMTGRITAGALLTIYMAADRVVTPLITMVRLFNRMLAATPLFDKIFPERQDVPAAPHQFEALPAHALIQLKNAGVGFGDHRLLENLNFALGSGDRVLVKGPSGSGKTTLLRSIVGELPVVAGAITYSAALEEDLQGAFSIVEQTPFIFKDTVRFNLTLGGAYEDEAVLAALRRVGLGALATPEGLDQPLGDDGTALSGGEAKRLELARALLANRRILIVDEALSGLDVATGEAIIKIIQAYPGAVFDIEHHVENSMLAGFTRVIDTKDYQTVR